MAWASSRSLAVSSGRLWRNQRRAASSRTPWTWPPLATKLAASAGLDDQFVLERQAGQLAGDIAAGHDAGRGGVERLGGAADTTECEYKDEPSHANPDARKIRRQG